MTDNEKQFIRTFVDFESNMKSARQYIKGVETDQRVSDKCECGSRESRAEGVRQ